MKIKLIEIAAFFAFTAVVVLSLINFESDCQGVRNACLRLHVIANSNSAEDQALKLEVRDAVLQSGSSFLGTGKTKEEAETAVKNNIETLENAAKQVIEENGYDYSVKVTLGKSRFPTKTYGNYTLPAGEYDAVKVIIGSGEGKNWWCVMFPSLCLPAAQNTTDAKDVFNEDELKLIKSNPKYEIRFWIVEKIEKMKESLGEKK